MNDAAFGGKFTLISPDAETDDTIVDICHAKQINWSVCAPTRADRKPDDDRTMFDLDDGVDRESLADALRARGYEVHTVVGSPDSDVNILSLPLVASRPADAA